MTSSHALEPANFKGKLYTAKQFAFPEFKTFSKRLAKQIAFE